MDSLEGMSQHDFEIVRYQDRSFAICQVFELATKNMKIQFHELEDDDVLTEERTTWHNLKLLSDYTVMDSEYRLRFERQVPQMGTFKIVDNLIYFFLLRNGKVNAPDKKVD